MPFCSGAYGTTLPTCRHRFAPVLAYHTGRTAHYTDLHTTACSPRSHLLPTAATCLRLYHLIRLTPRLPGTAFYAPYYNAVFTSHTWTWALMDEQRYTAGVWQHSIPASITPSIRYPCANYGIVLHPLSYLAWKGQTPTYAFKCDATYWFWRCLATFSLQVRHRPVFYRATAVPARATRTLRFV